MLCTEEEKQHNAAQGAEQAGPIATCLLLKRHNCSLMTGPWQRLTLQCTILPAGGPQPRCKLQTLQQPRRSAQLHPHPAGRMCQHRALMPCTKEQPWAEWGLGTDKRKQVDHSTVWL